MHKCSSCSYTSENGGKFCPECGNRMIEEVIYSAVPAPKASLGKKITAFALSITALLLASICFIVVFILALVSMTEFDHTGGLATLAVALVYGIMSGTPSIIALVLSGSCRKVGDKTAFTRLSKVFGLISLILTAIFLLMGMLAFIVV